MAIQPHLPSLLTDGLPLFPNATNSQPGMFYAHIVSGTVTFAKPYVLGLVSAGIILRVVAGQILPDGCKLLKLQKVGAGGL